ncbi:MAG: hypothetical protein ACLFV4_14460, partial [Candidatus Hydrogenedentota bacterium]
MAAPLCGLGWVRGFFGRFSMVVDAQRGSEMTDRCANARKTIEALKARRVLADGRKKTQRLAEAVWPRMNSIPPAVILLLGVSVFCWS